MTLPEHCDPKGLENMTCTIDIAKSEIFRYIDNTELNDLRKIICLRKSEVSVEKISVCYIIANLAAHDIHCLQCSYTNGVIDIGLNNILFLYKYHQQSMYI